MKRAPIAAAPQRGRHVLRGRSDWNTPLADVERSDVERSGVDRQLPVGIPDWAIGPLLTAGGIIVYLLVRNLMNR